MSILKWFKKIIKNNSSPTQLESVPLSSSYDQEQIVQPVTSIDKRLSWLKQKLSHSSDVIYHKFVAGPQLTFVLVYIKGMVDLKTIEQSILKVITSFDSSGTAEEFRKRFFELKQLPIPQQTVVFLVQDAISSIMDGDALLLIDGDERFLAISVSKLEKRAITESPNEAVIRGPREAFIENVEINLNLIRRRLKTPSFKTDRMHIGKVTQTTVAVAYLEGICKQPLVDEVKKRLSQIEIDAVLGSSYLEELIEDNPYSPFPQLEYSERPDVVSASLLEGRVAIIVDGTPIVIIAPVTLFMLMQSPEDYYQRYIAASWIRMIRYLFLFISFLLPSFYVAITTFHPDIIPERLLVTIAASREVVPFPALVEAFIMELTFEALREAAVRIPKSIGQAVSIIGALVIGTAAVEAGIVSAAMVIIVSLTGIASFITPHFDLGLTFRLLRFPIMFLAGMFGLYGIACGMIFIYLHLLELRSFGLPYLAPIAPFVQNDLKDTLGRAPWWAMKTRSSLLSSNRFRQRKDSRKWDIIQAEEEEG